MIKQQLAVFTPEDREDRRLAELEDDYRSDEDYVQHPAYWNSDGRVVYIHKTRLDETISDMLRAMAIERIVAYLERVKP